MNSFPLYFQTLPHLRPIQILYRARYALRNRVRPLTRTRANTNGKVTAIAWSPIQFVTQPLTYPWMAASDIAQGKFTFLNDSQDFGGHIDWNPDGKSRLWRYNLHYFQYLHPVGGVSEDFALNLMRNWVDRNPPGTPDAWDPFPISLRIVNWIKFLSMNGKQGSNSLCDSLAKSIYAQMHSLESSLEYHLLGNHLFKNAKTLVFAGLFFKGKDAKRWLTKGLAILQKEIDEQILPDGGHFERSPMYHSMILEDCLDLLNLFKGQGQSTFRAHTEKLEDVCRRMMRFLLGMSHPDGEIALFNDGAFGIEATPADASDYYRRVTGEDLPLISGDFWSFPESGYFVMSPRVGDHLIIDCGPIGPDYQPGHSHCDTLSFELSLKGKRVVVDSGSFLYEKDEIRDYNRGNSGHNTTTIDGQNQSKVWGAHRCARRAKPIKAKLEKDSNGQLTFEGAHDGYRRLKGTPTHTRRIRWSNQTIEIDDSVEGKELHSIESRLHIHPSMKVSLCSDEAVVSDNEDLRVSFLLSGPGKIEMVEGWYCPEFGKKLPCKVLVVKFKNEGLPFRTGWVIRKREV